MFNLICLSNVNITFTPKRSWHGTSSAAFQAPDRQRGRALTGPVDQMWCFIWLHKAERFTYQAVKGWEGPTSGCRRGERPNNVPWQQRQVPHTPLGPHTFNPLITSLCESTPAIAASISGVTVDGFVLKSKQVWHLTQLFTLGRSLFNEK